MKTTKKINMIRHLAANFDFKSNNQPNQQLCHGYRFRMVYILHKFLEEVQIEIILYGNLNGNFKITIKIYTNRVMSLISLLTEHFMTF